MRRKINILVLLELGLLIVFGMVNMLPAATFTVNTPELGDLVIVEADPYKAGDTAGNTLRVDGAGYWGSMDGSTTDNLWRERAIGPFLTGYEALAGSSDRVYELYGNDRVNAPELVTTVSGLLAGKYEVFLVHIYQIETDQDKSAILAGEQSSPVNIYDHTTYVSQIGTATGTWAVGISPIGEVVGDEIIVYVKGTAIERRCDYIGLAYKHVNECINKPPIIADPDALSVYVLLPNG